MKDLKFLFFGRLSGPINDILVCHGLDYLASINDNFSYCRENCLEIYEVFDDLKYDLSFMDIDLEDIEYDSDLREYKCSIYQNNNKIGFIMIDQLGRPRLIYDQILAPDLDPQELENQIDLLLTSNRGELIDSLMGILQFTRPIPLSPDMFLLSISDEDSRHIIDFFDLVFSRREGTGFDRPYFIHLDRSIYNMNEVSNLVADKMNEVLNAFDNTKQEFYNGFSQDMTLEDIEIIDRLIELTKDDLVFYERALRQNIAGKLDKKI